MKYPALVIDTQKLKENVQMTMALCQTAGIEVCAVTKAFCAIPEITQAYVEAGIKILADSRIENLKKIPYAGVEKWLLRLPMPCEAKEVVLYSDLSLNSELSTVTLLSQEAEKMGKKHGVLLMIDVGDLREGVMAEDAVTTAGEILKLPGVHLVGLGTNLNCYGGIIPTPDKMQVLLDTQKAIESLYGVQLPVISGGNSGSIYLVTDKTMPQGVNNLRIGEAILLGAETSYQQPLEGLHQDAFRLDVQIVELKEKPSLPFGEAGLNAFGEKVVYEDKGMMKRAIVACGRQDVYTEKLIPVDDNIAIIGASSDHTIIDVTHAKREYKVGDVVSFHLVYSGILTLTTSEYVHKVFV